MLAKLTNLEPGDVTFIYKRPITKAECEGAAELIEHIENSGGLELWEVEFLDQPGRIVRRWVNIGRGWP